MTTAGGKTLTAFFWAALIGAFCAIALGGIEIVQKRSCAPWQASSTTARLIDGKIVEDTPTVTKGCR